MTEYDEKTSLGIEDLFADDGDEQFAETVTTINTGTAGNTRVPEKRNPTFNPNATRWLFNPFEVIDLRNEPAGCGMPYLANVVFNRVITIDVNMGKDIRDTSAATPGSSHNAENYTQFARTAAMIASELINKNGDKGVIMIDELTGREDEAASLNQLLFGESVECVVDINNPEHPCPVLPNLLETMQANVKAALPGLDADTREVVLTVARRVRDSIAMAIRNCRTRIEIAQKRLLDDKNPNRYLSHAEQRCYIALGEEIPNQMPLLTKSAVAGNQGLSGADVVNAVVAGVTAAIGGKAPEPAAPSVPRDFANTDKLKEVENAAKEVDFGEGEEAQKLKKEPAKTTVKTGAKAAE